MSSLVDKIRNIGGKIKSNKYSSVEDPNPNFFINEKSDPSTIEKVKTNEKIMLENDDNLCTCPGCGSRMVDKEVSTTKSESNAKSHTGGNAGGINAGVGGEVYSEQTTTKSKTRGLEVSHPIPSCSDGNCKHFVSKAEGKDYISHMESEYQKTNVENKNQNPDKKTTPEETNSPTSDSDKKQQEGLKSLDKTTDAPSRNRTP